MSETGNTQSNWRGPVRTAAIAASAILGLFVIGVLVVLALTYGEYKNVYAEYGVKVEGDKPAMAELRHHLDQDPGNEQLKVQLRELDVQLRDRYFDLKHRLHVGIWLLLIGGIGLAAATKLAVDLGESKPDPHGENPAKVAGLLPRWALYTTAVVSFLIIGGAITLAVIFPDRITSERLGISQLVQRAEDEKAQMEMAAAAGQEKAEPKIDYGKWARFRGPGGNGTSKHTNVPTKWDGEGGENILWKTPLELTGASSPVVWGDKVICTGGANAAGGMAASVYFMDATTGKILWSKEVVTDDGAQGAESIEAFADYSWAAPTPCTDGETIVALFATGDIAGFDFTGKRLWIKHLGIPDMAYGYASSPIVYKDLVIVQWDTNAGSKLIALKSKSGELAWEAKREDVWASWATPIVITVDGKDQIVAAGDPWLMGHDPSEKGKVLWKADVMGGDIAPSPIFTGKHVIAAYSNGAGTVAIDPTQRGDLTDKLVWEDFDGASDMISPATNGKIIAQVTYGELFIRDATSKDGKVLSKFEIGGGTSSSPTIVGDRVYQMSDDGVMYVAKFDEDFKPVSEEPVKSPLGEQAWCSPAFVDGRIFIRGSKHLWCIGEKAK